MFTPLATRLLGDAGIGWHIRTGQQIAATHTIPRVDLFSATMAGRRWFAWEWLYDLGVGQLEAALGLNGVVWFTALLIAATFASMFHLLLLRGTSLPVALAVVLLVVGASMIHFLARPHVVSWLFTLIWFWILDSSERACLGGQGEGRGERWLWAIPGMMLVWVNVHGGFVVGFVLLGTFLAGAAWTWYRANESRIEELLQKVAARKRARKLFWVSLLSAAASLANPYGWNLYGHIYHYLSNRFLMDHIEEFQSPNFHGVAQKCFLLLLLVTVAVLEVRGRELRLSEALTVLFAVYAGLYASRNLPVSSILLGMVMGPRIPELRFVRGFSRRMAGVELGLRGHVWPVVATLLTLAMAANGGRAGSTVLMDAHFDSKRMPVEAVNFLQKSGGETVLSPDYWGGYLIYRLYPKTRVVVDDRHDLYGEDFFKSYLKMIHVERGWDEFLREHESSFVLLPREGALASVLAESSGWKQVYGDEVAVVFVRRSGMQ